MQDLSQPIPELGGRTWEELEVIEHSSGPLMFKDAIRKRSKTGTVETVPVRVQVLRVDKIAQARVDCRRLFAEIGLDVEKDTDLFAELEQVCMLALAIRDINPPHAQAYVARELIEGFDEASLQDVAGRIQALRQAIDVRESHLTEDELWRKIAAVARAGHLLPLTDIAGHEQPSCIVFMAEQAVNSPRGQSWLQSAATLTQEPSSSASSPSSSEAPTRSA
jgi:hypothetical protein